MSPERIGNEDVIEQLPASLRKLLSLERFHLYNVKLFQDTSRDPSFDVRYFPQNCGAFKLPCFWVCRRHLYVYGFQEGDFKELSLFDRSGQIERVLFPVHPTSLDHYRKFLSDVGARDAEKEGVCIWAVPTSSTRTLLAWPHQAPEKALFIKTSLHTPIFGDRRLYLKKVGRSVGFSKLMQFSRADLPDSFDYFTEPVGLVPRSMQDSGVIIRSIPQEIKDDRLVVAPLFSLLGGHGSYIPLLITMLERNGMEPLQFIGDILCAPFARLWLEMSMRFGIVLEAHGQDLMLALSPNLSPLARFFYRDFEGMQVDWEARCSFGLPAPENMPHAWAWHETYSTWGYRYSDLVWYKFRISLLQYLLFLDEVGLSLRQWHEHGLIRGHKFDKDDVTSIFSNKMVGAIEEMFGIRVGVEYNIYRSLNRFIIFLMKIRRELMMREGAVTLRLGIAEGGRSCR